MANLPGSGYLSHADRTEGEMQTALEQLHDVIAELGSKAPTLLTISGDAITAPLASMILVQSEAHLSDSADVLDSIGTTNITQGRLVILKNNDGTSTESAGQTITVTHGTSSGDITLTEGSGGTFLLCAERMLAIIYSGDRWVEVWRSYGRANSEDKLAERTSLGLGDVSTLDIAVTTGAVAANKVLKVGPANTIAEDDLLAMDASGNIKTGTVTGGNADTLDSLDSLSFVRTDAGSPQSINANVTSTTASATRIVTDTTGVSQTAGFAMHDDGVERALVYLDTQDGDVYLKTSDAAGAPQASIKIDAATGKLEYSSEMGTDPFVSLTPGAGNGLNADLLDDNEWADIPLAVLPTVRKITFVTSSMSNWSPNISPIPDLTNIDYPMAPNGSRRFLVTAHVRFQTGSDYESDREVGMRIYSTADYLASTGSAFVTEYTDGDIEHWVSGSRGELAIQDKIVTPAVNDRLTVSMDEISANNQSDLLADSGSGPMFNYTYTRPFDVSGTFNTYGSSRCYLCVEYLDEGA